jgi:RNA polymerase sigma-70 factor (ECF subfamily)
MSKGATPDLGTDPHVTEIVVAHYAELLRFVERRVGRRDLAEDIVQETLAANLEKLGALRDPDARLGWLYQTLRNAATDHHRRAKLTDRVHERVALESEKVEPDPEGILANPCSCPTRVARELKPEYADALRSMELEGASLQSYAEKRGISSGNAGVRAFRAREALRRELAFLCGTSAAHGCTSCTCEPDTNARR